MNRWVGYLLREMFVTSHGETFRARRLIDVPDAKAVLLPRGWARRYAQHGWVAVDYDADRRRWTIRPLSARERDAVQRVEELVPKSRRHLS